MAGTAREDAAQCSPPSNLVAVIAPLRPLAERELALLTEFEQAHFPDSNEYWLYVAMASDGTSCAVATFPRKAYQQLARMAETGDIKLTPVESCYPAYISKALYDSACAEIEAEGPCKLYIARSSPGDGKPRPGL